MTRALRRQPMDLRITGDFVQIDGY
jgi:hypothetical protein